MSLPIHRSATGLALACLLAACAGAPPLAQPEAPRTSTGVVDVPGGRLSYDVTGEGPFVVLIHGGFLDRRMWDGQVAPFARAGFRVVRYDLRGFGRSSKPEASYSPADDLLRLLDHLGAERAHVVGLSMGGSVAQDFALAHPERVDRLVLAASAAGGADIPPEDYERIAAIYRAARSEGLDRAVELWLAHPMLAPAMARPGLRERIAELSRDNAGALLLTARPTPPAAGRLGEIRAPTLVIIGGSDTPTNRRLGEDLATGIPDARRVVIEGAGHLLNMEEPAEFERIVVEFLRGSSPGSPPPH